MTTEYKGLGIVLLITTILLVIPLIAMQLTDAVNWSPMDFLVAAVLLIGSGLIISTVIKKMKNKSNRIIAIIAIVVLLLFVWAELAVGIFGTLFAGS